MGNAERTVGVGDSLPQETYRASIMTNRAVINTTEGKRSDPGELTAAAFRYIRFIDKDLAEYVSTILCSACEFLELVKKWSCPWVAPGHSRERASSRAVLPLHEDGHFGCALAARVKGRIGAVRALRWGRWI